MGEQELIAQLNAAESECERLRRLAHEAPFCRFSMDHEGHTSVEPGHHTYAWKDRGNEWVKACEKRDSLRRASKLSSHISQTPENAGGKS